MDLTRGELGTRGNAEIRDQEAAAAAKLMGASFRKNLKMADGFFAYNQANLLKIIQVIRWCRPAIVLANALDDRHPDHGRSAKLEADACFYSGLAKIHTVDEDGNPQERWRPKSLYHYIQDFHLKPDFVVDISAYIDRKFELIYTFRSQFHVPGSNAYSKELSSPISGEDFMEYMRSRAATYGRPSGFKYAEGFNISRTIGVKNLFDLA